MDFAVVKRSIKGYLEQLSFNVANNNALGRSDINKDAEDLVAELLNKVFGFNLTNANSTLRQNYPAVDLVDLSNKLAVQVSSTVSNTKIITTCEKFINHNLYSIFNRLMFYFITSKQNNYTKPTKLKINNLLAGKMSFDFNKDILNNITVSNHIDLILNKDKLKEIELLLAKASHYLMEEKWIQLEGI